MNKKRKIPIKIIGERSFNLNLNNVKHHEQINSIGKALSSPVRLKILNLLSVKTLSILEIAGILELPISSTALHLRILEEAQLIITESQPGLHGSMRVCVCSFESLHIENPFSNSASLSPQAPIITEMPIGSYSRCEIHPVCGLADEFGLIGSYDVPQSFYSPEHTRAQLIWFQQGFIQYQFPNFSVSNSDIRDITFSLELCSEAPGYKEIWPSDITIYINQVEITTYCSPGDFGARKGIITPNTWKSPQTQYGLLKNFSVRDTGAYLDDVMVNPSVTIQSLRLSEHSYIEFMLQIKDNAEYVGGINLFGEKFGDYPQGIIMRITY